MTTRIAPTSQLSPLAAAVLITWQRNGPYGLRLIADLPAAHMVAQPFPGRTLNHPAWILTHLNLYASIAVRLAQGAPFDDPAEHRFGQKSEPLPDAAAYDSKDALADSWNALHDSGAQALRSASAELLARPNPLERWRAVHPTIGDMLVTLMVKHESAHLGQLSAWRRAMGLPRVPM